MWLQMVSVQHRDRDQVPTEPLHVHLRLRRIRNYVNQLDATFVAIQLDLWSNLNVLLILLETCSDLTAIKER